MLEVVSSSLSDTYPMSIEPKIARVFSGSLGTCGLIPKFCFKKINEFEIWKCANLIDQCLFITFRVALIFDEQGSGKCLSQGQKL